MRGYLMNFSDKEHKKLKMEAARKGKTMAEIIREKLFPKDEKNEG